MRILFNTSYIVIGFYLGLKIVELLEEGDVLCLK